MELKYRKLIQSGQLKRFDGGTDFATDKQNYYNSTQPMDMRLQQIPSTNIAPKPNVPNKIQTTFNTQNPNGVDSTGTETNKTSSPSYFNAQNLSAAASDINNAFNMIYNQPSAGQIVSDTGTSNSNILGINYKRFNTVDRKTYMKNWEHQAVLGTNNAIYNGVTTGAAAGGGWGALAGLIIGGGIGIGSSLIGRSKLKKNLAKAEKRITALNIYNRSDAFTQGLQNKYYSENGNSGTIFSANRGKDLKKPTI